MEISCTQWLTCSERDQEQIRESGQNALVFVHFVTIHVQSETGQEQIRESGQNALVFVHFVTIHVQSETGQEQIRESGQNALVFVHFVTIHVQSETKNKFENPAKTHWFSFILSQCMYSPGQRKLISRI